MKLKKICEEKLKNVEMQITKIRNETRPKLCRRKSATLLP